MHIIFVLSSNRRVDLDNLSKNVLDGCNGIVFADDSQVVNLHLVKHVMPGASPGVFVNACAGGVLPALSDNYGLQIPP
jgi:Holliday junction resolvase RusA-like endonuclease